MSSKAFILKPEDRKPALNVIGVNVSVLAAEAAIADQQITEQSGSEGVGPPPHCHDWDESFYVTKGQVVFNCDGITTQCTPGTLVHIPAGNVHAFSFGPDGGEMLEITGKGSGAVAMFTMVDREIPPGPPDIAKLVKVAEECGLTLKL